LVEEFINRFTVLFTTNPNATRPIVIADHGSVLVFFAVARDMEFLFSGFLSYLLPRVELYSQRGDHACPLSV
jgi:hypothetical protein